MAESEKHDKHYQRQQERKRLGEGVVSDDDAPITNAPVKRARAVGGTGRNDPCPCGSGKKYKKCCGKAS